MSASTTTAALDFDSLYPRTMTRPPVLLTIEQIKKLRVNGHIRANLEGKRAVISKIDLGDLKSIRQGFAALDADTEEPLITTERFRQFCRELVLKTPGITERKGIREKLRAAGIEDESEKLRILGEHFDRMFSLRLLPEALEQHAKEKTAAKELLN